MSRQAQRAPRQAQRAPRQAQPCSGPPRSVRASRDRLGALPGGMGLLHPPG